MRYIRRRLAQALLVVSFLAYYATVGVKQDRNSRDLQIEANTRWKPTYAIAEAQKLYTEPTPKYPWTPDTTAVILNWSRLPNVVQIVKIMCTSLQDTLAEVLIWNNNPQPLISEDFAEAHCPGRMLNIYNSPENVYFQARFFGCTHANTRFCFIQDDDYFIQPSIIRAMRARMSETQSTSLHLLPSHEVLYSRSSTIRIDSSIHTLFAWLGYGSMMERSQAQEFLDLLQTINATEDIFRMADNYFTILSNRVPELWFDQNHELGGGTPFTVGTLGEERNNNHIINAGLILDSLVQTFSQDVALGYPYISIPTPFTQELPITRAVCFDTSCVMETNIKLLPMLPNESVTSASDVINHTAERFSALGNEAMERYLEFPPSSAVDGNSTTSFRSVSDAVEDDWIALDWMAADFGDNLELALLVNEATQNILENCRFEHSADGESWDQLPSELECSASRVQSLRECSVVIGGGFFRKVRLVLKTGVPCGWIVHEIWLRQSRPR
ncbi:hypothetical protein P691DRAFT_656895 [Macrolepiota fuliginosa MF-IS2]|uniref:Uncharacterized protein n=1 Tax=Macrolepiota fuliginosa MF-IS2 TaxID=1400762 RepID=A0A9P5XNS9_9AGAR|nr:hypothetical protein P691DRAFT_656895 [Macrolepiota fuliginosa MF-IS2]